MPRMFYDLVSEPKHLYNALVKSTACVFKNAQKAESTEASDRNAITVRLPCKSSSETF